MDFSNLNRSWLPYLVAVIGITASLVLWLILREGIQPYMAGHQEREDIHLLLVLVLGILVSLLMAVLVRFVQSAYSTSITLQKVNEDLKKNIAERIAAEESRQKLEVALLQGQKLQAMGTLAGGIAHDFNNILYAIIGYTEMTREDSDKDGLAYKNLGKVLDAAHKGQDLVSRILAFSRRQHHDFNPLPLKHTIEAALSLLTPAIPASVMIDFDAAIDPVILGNQTQIHQVLVNLINNAVNAMDGEGSIRIHLTPVPKGDSVLKEFPDTLPQNYCRIEIADTGHGMDQNTMERIFEPFFTTKEVGKGTGLGLSIVHSIIKEHQGEITVSSQIGKGTTFTILLPVMEEKLNG